MNCHLVRDLLPLYVEGDCSDRTNQLIKEHLTTCRECHELHELMEEPIHLPIEDKEEMIAQKPIESTLFWKKYYGELLWRGIGLFLMIYVVVVLITLLR
ncbi:anti-sigma factor family protein [Bacillus sp. FJAT-45037]|uniref:anti-sigma factor family protein n=1 Tax=Bacillus sp. FJAT-45037 TaxID=2011007 RepID=UPI000C237A45|nr:zf-HC2 domain-containing protein [Bacillus sp. FJAT-45037]